MKYSAMILVKEYLIHDNRPGFFGEISIREIVLKFYKDVSDGSFHVRQFKFSPQSCAYVLSAPFALDFNFEGIKSEADIDDAISRLLMIP